MKKIKSFSDIQFIVNNKLDFKDFRGYKISFVTLLGMSLLEVINMINEGNHSYDPDDAM